MPKKRTTRKPRNGRGHAGGRTSGSMPPLVALHGLRDDFASWAEANPAGAGDPTVDDLLADVEAAVSAAVHLGLRNLFFWTPRQVEGVVESLLHDEAFDASDEDGEGELHYRVASSLLPFFDYLGASGQWAGTPEELEEAADRVESVLDDHAHDDIDAVTQEMMESLAEVPEPDPAVRDAALRALPLVQQVLALLRWLGPSRSITDSGALRDEDVPAAAVAVGVDLGAPPVTSLQDDDRVAVVWGLAVRAGLVHVDGPTAQLADHARAWLDEEDDETAPVAVLVTLLVSTITGASPTPLGSPETIALVPLLTAAVTGRPFPLAQVAEVSEAIMLQLRAAAEDGSEDEARDLLTVLDEDRVRPALDRLVEEGVVRVGTDPPQLVTVTPGLEQAVAAVLDLILLGSVLDGADEIDGEWDEEEEEDLEPRTTAFGQLSYDPHPPR